MQIPYVKKKTVILRAKLLRVNPAMIRTAPDITIHRAQKRLARAFDKEPVEPRQSKCNDLL